MFPFIPVVRDESRSPRLLTLSFGYETVQPPSLALEGEKKYKYFFSGLLKVKKNAVHCTHA